MNKKHFTTLLSLFILSLPTLSLGITFPDKPSSKNYFVDEAKLISAESGNQVDNIASALFNQERIPLYVVTIPSLASHDAVTSTIEQYATALFNEWGIGSQDRNYGILLLVSKADRKARIELGADWGGEYDRQAQKVMDELIVPAFKRGDFSIGIADGVRGLDAMARGLQLPKPTNPWWFWPLVIGSVIVMIMMIVSLFRSGRRGWAWVFIAFLGAYLFFIFSVLFRDSGSSGGFGGGSSSGGGASGSW